PKTDADLRLKPALVTDRKETKIEHDVPRAPEAQANAADAEAKAVLHIAPEHLQTVNDNPRSLKTTQANAHPPINQTP
ncbi:HlyD family secretion protein, partial [Pseudomonas syringae pv. tagetis]